MILLGARVDGGWSRWPGSPSCSSLNLISKIDPGSESGPKYRQSGLDRGLESILVVDLGLNWAKVDLIEGWTRSEGPIWTSSGQLEVFLDFIEPIEPISIRRLAQKHIYIYIYIYISE